VTTTFCAMQIASTGVLERVQRPIPVPAADEVLIKIEACGVCGADLSDSEKSPQTGAQPRIPGHEIVGYITRRGKAVPDIWKAGQRVGVGRLGGYCQYCGPCRNGQYHLCENQLTPGLSCDGGYAEYVVMRHTALINIPAELSSLHAAPVLCAGTATFNALRHSGARAGDRVMILGIGGLGHMAIQYAHKMGFEVISIGRGRDKEAAARELGSHHYIDGTSDEWVAHLKSLGPVKYILATAPDAERVSLLLPLLAPQGKVILLGAGRTPVHVMPGVMVGGERTLSGSFVSTPVETELALRFSHLFQALPVIEVMPLLKANEALTKLREGKARYRIVLTME